MQNASLISPSGLEVNQCLLPAPSFNCEVRVPQTALYLHPLVYFSIYSFNKSGSMCLVTDIIQLFYDHILHSDTCKELMEK